MIATLRYKRRHLGKWGQYEIVKNQTIMQTNETISATVLGTIQRNLAKWSLEHLSWGRWGWRNKLEYWSRKEVGRALSRNEHAQALRQKGTQRFWGTGIKGQCGCSKEKENLVWDAARGIRRDGLRRTLQVIYNFLLNFLLYVDYTI